MKTLKPCLAALLLLISNAVASASSAAPGENWPQWRGPLANGISPAGKPPVEWSETKNIKWKAALPGRGMATPTIWGDQLFVLTAVPFGEKREASAATFRPGVPRKGGGDRTGGRRRGGRSGGFTMSQAPAQSHRFVTLALDRNTGKTIWQKTAREEFPHEGHHRDHGFASSSPVTDGELLFAHFGSRGLYCYDLNGELKWDKDLGDMRTRAGFGEGVSPALAGDRLIVNWDHEGQSFIVALDKQTGREIWRKNRDEQTSWTTPFIVEIEGKKQAIVAGTKKTRSYDVESGEVVWEASGQTANMIPTPVVGHGLVFLASGFRGNALQAIKLTAKGDVSGTGAIVWRHDRGTPYVPSTLLSGERLYFLKGNDAMISCFAAPTGKAHYEEERLEGLRGVYASPVGANGYVYILGRQGALVVIKDSPELTIVGRNKLDDRFDASPAIVGNHLYLRGHNNLYCIVEK
jgi:outer membrane protein assembly factor BamB